MYNLSKEDKHRMKRKGFLIIILCALLTAFVLCGCLANSEATGRGRKETEAESTQSLVTLDGIVYGEVSAVGEETLTIRLGTLETEEDGLKLTGGEIAIRTKTETVIARMRRESTGSGGDAAEASDEEVGFAMGNLAEGDIVSIALDEEGYAETITLLMNFSSVGMDR